MNYKVITFVLLSFLFLSCDQSIKNSQKQTKIKLENRYKNSGFALIYNESLENIKKIENRSLDIYHKSLKRKSIVKITNPENGKYIMAVVKSNRIKFSDFYNSILSQRIADDLELDVDEPYIEMILISKNSTFIAKKTKMFDEEKTVAEKAPVDGILINDLNETNFKKKEVKNKTFSYSIKVADFYYKDTASSMIDRINKEVSINNLMIKKLSTTKYRVLIGPFNDIKSLRDSFEKMSHFYFDNLEILNND
ncbi:hypothetical protein OAN68_02825 [Candidatus Pelagibacter sp.]|nr:hypothetical protein [Candidatus Pelagibacter sp.]